MPQAPGPGSTPPAHPAGPFLPGDTIPYFGARRAGGGTFRLEAAVGRYVVLMFFGWAGDPLIRAALDRILDRDGLFDEERVRFVGIGRDSDDAAMTRLAEEQPGRSFLPDVDGRISRSFGVMQAAGTADGAQPARHSLVLDPGLRVMPASASTIPAMSRS